jgi:hypothetical protein
MVIFMAILLSKFLFFLLLLTKYIHILQNEPFYGGVVEYSTQIILTIRIKQSYFDRHEK